MEPNPLADEQIKEHRLKNLIHVLEVAAIVFAIDQLTKLMVTRNLKLYESWEPFPGWGDFFQITYTHNTGAAFGMLKDFGNVFLVIAVLVSIAILYYVFTYPNLPPLIRLSLGLQLGGALGNMWDRIRIGPVIDFIDVGFFAIFNIADAAIVVGVSILAYWLWTEESRTKKQAEAPDLESEAPEQEALNGQ